jgi:hypothetical protein
LGRLNCLQFAGGKCPVGEHAAVVVSSASQFDEIKTYLDFAVGQPGGIGPDKRFDFSGMNFSSSTDEI